MPEAGVPDFRHLLFAIVDHFGTDHAPAVVARQAGGKGAVFQDGVTVGAAHFHLVGVAATLTSDHLVVAFIDVGIFGIQVRPGLRAFQFDLIVAVVHVAGSGDGAHRIRLAGVFRLVQLNFFGGQGAVTLLDMHVAAEQGAFRVVGARVIGIDGHRLAVRIAADQRLVVNGNAKHALLGQISQRMLTVECRPNHRGQQCWETFSYAVLVFRHQRRRVRQTVRDYITHLRCASAKSSRLLASSLGAKINDRYDNPNSRKIACALS